MSRIVRTDAYLCDIPVERPRTDAIQSFVKQETIFVEIGTAEGITGTGYAYTIGTGGRAVLGLLRADLLDRLIGEDAREVEALWQKLFWATHATAVGPNTSLALAAADTALWDIRCLTAAQSLWLLAGGARSRMPAYDMDGGWLRLSIDELVTGARHSLAQGWPGVKLKVGKPDLAEDQERLAAVRQAVGPRVHLMVDANRSMPCPQSSPLIEMRARLAAMWGT